MARVLLELDSSKIISGVWPGTNDLAIPLWKTGSNVQFSRQGIQKIQGWGTPLTPTGSTPVRGMAQIIDSSGQKLYWGDQTDLYKWNTATVTNEGSGFTGNVNSTVTQPATVWSFVEFGSWVLATNGVDAPQVDKGSGFNPMVINVFTTAEIFKVRGPHVLAFNTSLNNKGFAWASADAVEDWVPTASNSAGDLIIRELDGEIVAAEPLGDRIAVYGQDQMFVVSYLGSPNYFGYKPAQNGIGARSKESVVAVGRRNYGWGQQGFFVTDGVSFEYIDNPAIKDFIETDLNKSQEAKINGFHDEENQSIVWHYPSVSGAGEPDSGVVYDYKNKVWSLLGYGRTASIERDVFTYALTADDNGAIFYENFGVDADGSALTASVQSRPIDFGVPQNIKEMYEIRIGYSGSGLRFRIGTQDKTSDSISWGSYTEVAQGFSINEIELSGRFITLELQSQDVGDNWDVTNINMYGRVGSEF